MQSITLSTDIEKQLFGYFNEITHYILHLNLAGVPIMESQRKTGFLGFLICINSLKEMYQTFIIDKKELVNL